MLILQRVLKMRLEKVIDLTHFYDHILPGGFAHNNHEL